MSCLATYAVDAPTREETDALPGLTLLEFGANGCQHCRAAQPAIELALREQPALRHIKVEDGPGRRLGRSYRVKLWPTLILLRDGQEIARLVRPTEAAGVRDLLAGRPG